MTAWRSFKIGGIFMSLLICLSLSACAGAVVGAAIDTTIEVAKVPFKVAAAAIDLLIPDADREF